MKRDLEHVAGLLGMVEETADKKGIIKTSLIKNYCDQAGLTWKDADQMDYTIELCIQEGLLSLVRIGHNMDVGVQLTWKGHNFLAK
ncbi:DUF2513 domain-containing protein [Pseudomonas sp. 51_B]|uniref:DUF2513 domain-containing protein n=1 Tax=Pseudomonas sp. 51_B TaxID=2813573 RepID=UPI001A9F612B|nr:DUF2513 domain-containing protein [Pseudomonas sp. 51_B]